MKNDSKALHSSPNGSTKRRRFTRLFQFSIFRLLLLILVFGIVLGAWSSTIRINRQQWKTVRPLIAQGAVIETSSSNLPDWVKRFLPEGETENVDAIFFRSKKTFASKDLECLKRLPFLKRLYVERCNLTDKDVETISQHKPLERLAIWGNKEITDVSASKLHSLENLDIVDIHETSIGWRGILKLKENKNLKVVYYGRRQSVDDSDLEEMAAAFSDEVHYLTVENSSATSIERAMDLFPDLSYVTLDSAPSWTDSTLQRLQSLGPSEAFSIKISSPEGTDDHWWATISKHFISESILFEQDDDGLLRLRNRENSNLRLYVDNLSNDIFKRYSKHPAISSVSHCRFTNTGREKVATITPYLENVFFLELERCQMKSFQGWTGNESLTRIELTHCDQMVTIEGLEKFKDLKTLEVFDSSSLASVSVESKANEIASLETIKFWNTPKLDSFDNFAALSSLKFVTLYSCELLTDLTWISNNPKLAEVEVTSCHGIETVENINHVPKLKKLELKKPASYRNSKTWTYQRQPFSTSPTPTT